MLTCNKSTSRRLRPITIARPDAATGSPCPICPYAFPAKEATIPRSAKVVANPSEKAIASPIT
mgnify:CR=1 FL=1